MNNHSLTLEDMMMDDDFIQEIEKEAEKYEVTVDYYLQEFFI
jgi:hypothetical protein